MSQYTYWFDTKKADVYKDVTGLLTFLDRDQSYKSTDNLMNLRMYGNMELPGLSAYNYLKPENNYSVHNRVTLNVVQSMIDTVVSKITKNKPRPQFLTSGGDFTLQQRAKKLTKFIDGVFYSTKFYEKSSEAFKSACIFGTGAVKIYRDGDKLKCEQVFIDEIKVDDTEAYYGEPRTLLQTKFVHKEVLKKKFPGYAGDIEVAAQNQQKTSIVSTSPAKQVDMIKVTEAWYLATSKDKKDGRHSIVIENCTLFDEKYDKTYFPFVFFRWNKRPLGFFGQGLSEQLRGLQVEINKILRTIQVSMHLVSVPKLLVEAGSKVVTAHLNNKIGGIIKYAGTKPEYAPLGSIPPELFAHLDRLYNRAYEIAGISQLSATSEKPAGLNSGKALREYNDLETKRFMEVALRYEAAHIEAAQIMVDMASDIDDFEVNSINGKFLENLKLNEIILDEDSYVMQAFPTSSLSRTPSGRLAEIKDLLSLGFLTRESAMKLLNFPDLESYMNLETSGTEDIDRSIEIMIDDGVYNTPEPYQNLEYGKVKIQQAYLFYKNQNAPEERLELLRRWISDADALQNIRDILSGTK